MSYTLDKTLNHKSFPDVVDLTRQALARHGFGVLTEIDVRGTMKKKLDAEMGDYMILGACNPKMALEALQAEPRVGAMLPCNVIVRAIDGDKVMVSAIDPVASMQAIQNPELMTKAAEVRSMLAAVIEEL